jgi:hypothetical protein
MKLKPLFFAATALGVGSPSPASAAYLFTLSGDHSASFQLAASPAPVNSFAGDANFFWLTNIAGTYQGVAGARDTYFYTTAIGGGFGLKNTNNASFTFVSDGPQLFTGTNIAPTFTLGTFALVQFNGPARYSLTISDLDASPTPPGAVPEPATWAMMLLGFGAIGFAMRRQKARVSYA